MIMIINFIEIEIENVILIFDALIISILIVFVLRVLMLSNIFEREKHFNYSN